MAFVKKVLDQNIPGQSRSVNFTSSDAVQGDLLLVSDSLGRPARYARFTASGNYVQVRLNTRQTVFPKGAQAGLHHTSHLPVVASGIEYMQSGTAILTVDANSTVELSSIPIDDVHLITVAGEWDFFLN